MQKLLEYNQAKRNYRDARIWLDRIGKVGHDGVKGKLHSVTVRAIISYQAHAGATNYHENDAICKAIEKVISRNFASLCDEAMSVLENDVARLKGAAMEEYKAEFYSAPSEDGQG